MSFMQMSLSGAVMIAAITVIRALTLHRVLERSRRDHRPLQPKLNALFYLFFQKHPVLKKAKKIQSPGRAPKSAPRLWIFFFV